MADNILKELNIREAQAREQAKRELLAEIKDIIAAAGKDIQDGITGN
jgi:hypothetical protein